MNHYKNVVLESLMLLVISAIFSPFAMYSFVLTVPALPLKKKKSTQKALRISEDFTA